MNLPGQTGVEAVTYDTMAVVRSDVPIRSPTTGRLDFIDGIRALAALFVVVGHSYYEPQNGYYASRFMNHLGLTYGHVAVDIFITLSGFCLMLPIAKRNDKFGSSFDFFRRRARRILPPYYAAILLSILFILTIAHKMTGTVWDNCLPLTWASILKHLFLVHDLHLPGGGGSINYPLWSIAVEFQLYLLMPLIALSLRRWNSCLTLIWTMGAGIGIHLLSGALDNATPWYLGLFTMGAIAAREGICRPMRQPRSLRLGTYVLWMLIAVAILLKGKHYFEAHLPYYDTAVGVAAALLLYVSLLDVSERHSLLTRLFSWRPLVFVGGFSYSLYLIHAPLLHLFDRIFAPFLPAGPLMFVALLLTIPLIVGIAYLFYLAFEKPFLSNNSHLKRGQK